MTEETKNTQEPQKEEVKEEKKSSVNIKTIGMIALGVVLIILSLWAMVAFSKSLWILIKGCIGPFLLLAGLIVLAIARE